MKLSFCINSSLLLYWWKSRSVLRMAATSRTKTLVPCSLHSQQAAEWPVGIVALDVSVYWIHSPAEKEWPSEPRPSPPLLRRGLPWMWTHCSRSHLCTHCLPSDQLPPPGTGWLLCRFKVWHLFCKHHVTLQHLQRQICPSLRLTNFGSFFIPLSNYFLRFCFGILIIF